MHKIKNRPPRPSVSFALIIATAVAGLTLTTTSNSFYPAAPSSVVVGSDESLMDRVSFTSKSQSRAEVAQDKAKAERVKAAANDKAAIEKAAQDAAEKAKIDAETAKNKAIEEAKSMALADHAAKKKADEDAAAAKKAKEDAAAAEKKAKEDEAKRVATAASGVVPSYSGGGTKEQWMAAAGIPEDQWTYVDFIVSKESGWNPGATNASSGACGLAQALPCSKIGGAGGYDPVTALRWQKDYVEQRYGGYAGAYAFWTANHWY